MAQLQKEKSQIKREDLRNSLLKQVIIRLDFTSMVDLNGYIGILTRSDWFKTVFTDYKNAITEDNVNVEDRTTRINDSNGKDVRVFYGCNIPPEKNTNLAITEDVICLTINCDNNYYKIDDYIELVKRVWDLLISFDSYVKIKRIGIRKIDGIELPNGNDANRYFEYFDQGVCNPGLDYLLGREYTDRFIKEPQNIKIIYTRNVRLMVGEEGNTTFIFVLDTDTYADYEMFLDNVYKWKNKLRPDYDELGNLLMGNINTASFEMFKRGVTKEFLNMLSYE